MLLRAATFALHSPAIHEPSWLSWRQAEYGRVAERPRIDLRAAVINSVMRIVGLDGRQ